MRSVLKSLQDSVLASGDENQDKQHNEDEPEHEHGQEFTLANAVKSMDQTPMMTVINILNSLRGSLPAGKRWMLDKIIRQLSHSKEGDLYTPYSIAKQGVARKLSEARACSLNACCVFSQMDTAVTWEKKEAFLQFCDQQP